MRRSLAYASTCNLLAGLALTALAACGASSAANGAGSDGSGDSGVAGDSAPAADGGGSSDATAVAYTIIASNQSLPSGLATDLGSVYWTNANPPHSIIQAPKAGGTLATLVSNAERLSAVALSAQTSGVYFTVEALDGSVNVLLPLHPTTTPIATNQSVASGVATNATNLFWSLGPPDTSITGAGQILETSLYGGQQSIIVSGLNQPQNLLADAENVYWLDSTAMGYSINKASISAGQPMMLAAAAAPTPMAIDSSNVYWFNTEYDAVYALPIGGGHVSTIAAGVASAQALAADGSFVYVYGDDSVRAVPVTGGTPRVLASGLLMGSGLTVDDSFVYWASVDGRVMRASKPGPDHDG
jgi:hypothetical protein